MAIFVKFLTVNVKGWVPHCSSEEAF